IVLFNHSGDVRRISLRPDRVNIITGGNRAGETALIEIIDYCLGSGENHIPPGLQFQSVSSYGPRLLLRGGQMVVARRAPALSGQASSDYFFKNAGKLDIPPVADLEGLTSRDTFISILSKAAGITENLHVPPEGQSKPSYSATIRHALFYTFQPQ